MGRQSAWFCCFVIFCVFFVFGEAQSDDSDGDIEIYVSTNNSSSSCSAIVQCGTIECPCSSIQSSLDSLVHISNLTSVRIILLPGIYEGKNNQKLSSSLTCPLHFTSYNNSEHSTIQLSNSFITRGSLSSSSIQISSIDFDIQIIEKRNATIFQWGSLREDFLLEDSLITSCPNVSAFNLTVASATFSFVNFRNGNFTSSSFVGSHFTMIDCTFEDTLFLQEHFITVNSGDRTDIKRISFRNVASFSSFLTLTGDNSSSIITNISVIGTDIPHMIDIVANEHEIVLDTFYASESLIGLLRSHSKNFNIFCDNITIYCNQNMSEYQLISVQNNEKLPGDSFFYLSGLYINGVHTYRPIIELKGVFQIELANIEITNSSLLQEFAIIENAIYTSLDYWAIHNITVGVKFLECTSRYAYLTNTLFTQTQTPNVHVLDSFLVFAPTRTDSSVFVEDFSFTNSSLQRTGVPLNTHTIGFSTIDINGINYVQVHNLKYENINGRGAIEVRDALSCTISEIQIYNCKQIFSNMVVLNDVRSFDVVNFSADGNQINGPFGTLTLSAAHGNVVDLSVYNQEHRTHTASAILINEESSVSLFASRFKNCSASAGGAISATDSYVNILNTIFESCSSRIGMGGAVQGEKIEFYASNVTVSNCTSVHSGAGFDLAGAWGEINSSNFTFNEAVRYGGAVHISGEQNKSMNETMKIISCLFFDNHAQQGGAIETGGYSQVTIQDSTFLFNKATSLGGGIVITSNSLVDLLFGELSDNHADSLGGAIYLMESATLVSSEAIFSRNTAKIAGGAINAKDNSQFSLFSILMEYNQAEDGGAILIDSTNKGSEIENCCFSRNFANSTGAAISGHSAGALNISYSEFNENIALSGAGIWMDNFAQIEISHSNFSYNFAQSRGGAILLSDETSGTIKHCLFRYNIATSTGGGAIWVQDQSSPVISFCAFLNNTGANGGALSSTSSAGPIVRFSDFLNNTSQFSGGAIFLQHSESLITNCTCKNNFAYSGGCLAAVESAVATISHFLVSENCAQHNGGGLFFLEESTPHMDFITLADNLSQRNGGGIYMDFKISGISKHCVYIRNEAVSGGGIYNEGASHVLDGAVFVENHAATGGAITFVLTTPAIVYESDISIFNNIICEENTAILGGAVYLLPSRIPNARSNRTLFSEPKIRNNNAELGGGVYLEVQTIPPIFEGAEFSANIAKQMGGALYVSSMDIDRAHWIRNSNFIGNIAEWAGSSVVWRAMKDSDEGDSFCLNCTFTVGNNPNSYQSANGTATYPLYLAFTSPCPPSATLDKNEFSVAVSAFDEFRTMVKGQMLIDAPMTAQLNSSCFTNGPITQHINSDTGKAEFTNVLLRGRNNDSCQIFVTASSTVMTLLQAQTCTVYLYGCGSDERIISGDGEYDTCKEMFISPTAILWTTISILVFVIFAVLLLGLLFNFRKYKRKQQRQLELLPLFNERPMVSLESILNDPDILRVDWNEISQGERIGVGAAGLVTKGIWTKGGEEIPVAMKELLIGFDTMEAAVIDEFLTEIKLLSAMKHENIVCFLGVSCPKEDPTKICLITELMDLGSVKDLMKNNPHLSWKERIHLMVGAAKGLKYLHDNKLIHRDVKPHNLLVNSEMECKIADFGISTVMPEYTRTMTCVGTPVYMAPEVLSLEKYSAKADVYSFGILLIEIITNLKPYSIGEAKMLSNPVLMYHIIEKGIRPEHGPLPEGLQQLINECVDSNPEFRPSFDEILTRLKRLEKEDVDIYDILMYSRKLEKENGIV